MDDGAKLAGVPKMVALSDQIGLGQGFRLVTGVVEVMDGIGLLFRPSALLAALDLAATMAVAAGVHLLKVRGSPLPARLLLVPCAEASWQVHRSPPKTPSA